MTGILSGTLSIRLSSRIDEVARGWSESDSWSLGRVKGRNSSRSDQLLKDVEEAVVDIESSSPGSGGEELRSGCGLSWVSCWDGVEW